jgi:galactoside O-acetyltransferase
MTQHAIPGVTTFEFTKIIGIENIQFGTNIIIDDFVLIQAKQSVRIGNYVHIASFASITGGGECVMDDFSGLSSGVRIITGSDDFKDFGFGNPTVPLQFRNVKRGRVEIGKFAIIGANSVILPDVVIGEGASIGAGSVIAKDLQPWGIYIGQRKIGERDREGVLKNYGNFLKSNTST